MVTLCTQPCRAASGDPPEMVVPLPVGLELSWGRTEACSPEWNTGVLPPAVVPLGFFMCVQKVLYWHDGSYDAQKQTVLCNM